VTERQWSLPAPARLGPAAEPAPLPFPGRPPHPVYREPHRVGAGPVLSGLGAGAVWSALFGGLAHDLASYAWWTLVATVSAWVVALILTRFGDRGVATGIALVSGLALSIAVGVVAVRWIATDNWPMW
jgi:hypothetical protein